MPSLLGALWPTWRMHHPKKWGGPLVIFWDALEISGSLWRRSGTLHDVPGRSTALWDSPGAFWRTLWGVLWTLWGWMGDADDGGDGDGDGEDLRLSFLYIQTPDQPPPRPLCYASYRGIPRDLCFKHFCCF